MSIFTERAEIEELGNGLVRQLLSMKPIAVRENGSLLAMETGWRDSGIVDRPHIVSRAPMAISVGNDGMRRMHPTRELDRYIEIGAPYVRIGGTWTQVSLGIPTRTRNSLVWERPQSITKIEHGGHFVKLSIELLNGFVPENNQIAFPVGISGLTRSANRLLRDGEPVGYLNSPVLLDGADPNTVLPIDDRIVNIGGQPYWLMTLPDLAGINRPIIDPTVTLQPDGAGIDVLMLSANPTFNYGAYADLDGGERNDGTGTGRSLIKFDLSSIPSNATVNSATLSLYLFLELSSNIRTFRFYRMVRAWTEGTGTGSATGDGATWNTYNGVNNWGTAGADNTTSDREAADIGYRSMIASETLNQFKDWPLTASKVQEWISGAFANNGMLLRADTENNDMNLFRSSDHATAAERPKLVIDYTTPNSNNFVHSPMWGRF